MRAEGTIELVRAARDGCDAAWAKLVDRFWDRWLAPYHHDLGTTIRRVYDAEDLVQSALLEAGQRIGSLRDEGAFFVWMTTIIRHKLARKRATARRERPRSLSWHDERPASRAAPSVAFRPAPQGCHRNNLPFGLPRHVFSCACGCKSYHSAT